MNLRVVLAAGAAAAAVAAGWMLLAPPDLEPLQPAPEIASTSPAGSAREQRGPDPGGAAPKPGPAGTAAPKFVIAPPPPTLFNEYLASRQYRILYDRLADSAQGRTPEGRLVLYEVLRQCALVTGGLRPGYRPNPPSREDFLKTIPETDPQRERRIAAFDEFAHDRCKGFEGVTVTRQGLLALLEESAAGGNAQARALAMEQALWDARRAGNATLTDAHIESLRQVLETRDPEAIRVAGRILANSWNDYALRAGPEQLPVEQRPFVNAFLVLSCEYGAPCGADTPRMLEACALRGHCNAQSFPDYLYHYGTTPHDAGLLIQYRELVRNAIETGNWSQLQVVRGAPNPRNRMTFVPGPR